MTLDLGIVAYHEAGHAVAAYFLDYEIETASILFYEDGDLMGGRVEHKGSPHIAEDIEDRMPGLDDLDDAKYQHTLESRAIVALAGKVAQRRFRPESITDEVWEGMRPDRLQVYAYLDRLTGSNSDQELRDAWERLLELRTDRLLEQWWSSVEAVASALLRERTLTGEQVGEVIREAALRKRGRA